MGSAETSSRAGSSGDGEVIELAIGGMHCESCVALLEEVLIEQPGVRSASVDLATASAVVRVDHAVVGTNALQSAIAEAGYSATPTG